MARGSNASVRGTNFLWWRPFKLPPPPPKLIDWWLTPHLPKTAAGLRGKRSAQLTTAGEGMSDRGPLTARTGWDTTDGRRGGGANFRSKHSGCASLHGIQQSTSWTRKTKTFYDTKKNRGNRKQRQCNNQPARHTTIRLESKGIERIRRCQTERKRGVDGAFYN